MPSGRPTDKYANIATGRVTESAAGTISFTEIITGASLGNNTAWLIDEIDYQFDTGTIEDLVASGDSVQAGLCTSNSVTGLNFDTDTRIIHSSMISPSIVSGTGTTLIKQPTVYQFFPPLVVASPRLYLTVLSGSLAAAATCRFRVHYRFLKLTVQEYLEIAEAFTIIS